MSLSPLLKWYGKNKRDLPWRKNPQAYRIWLCEIIMQQTRISQGISYYEKFVKAYPTPADLAAAPEDEVLKLWQGLGYYSRARNLHAAAKSMNGKFPTTYEGVRALKGVGDYTAAAICSIAYNMPYAVVDGNVFRVLSRVFGIQTPIDSTDGKKEFSMLAQKLLDKKNPGDFNQALMDFGALVCTPQAPQCDKCPFEKKCVARLKNQVEKFPVKAQKTKISTRYFHYIYVEQGNYLWLHKRSGKDIWQNLYELPLVETSDEKLTPPTWLGNAKITPVGKPVKHVLSHQIIYARLYKVKISPSRKLPADFLRISRKDFPKYAISRLVQKLVEQL